MRGQGGALEPHVDDAGDRDAATSAGGGCEEGADVPNVVWQSIREGLDDFVLVVKDASGSSTARGLNGVAFGNGIWLIVGASRQFGDTRIHWATSFDGDHWQSASQETEGVVGVVSRVFFVRGQFLWFVQQKQSDSSAASNLIPYTTTDGRSWEAHAAVTGMNYVWNVASDATHVLAAAGGDAIWSSEDLATWTQHTPVSGTSGAGVLDVLYDGGRFMVNLEVSSVVNHAYHGEGRLYTSTDADHWQRVALDGFTDMAIAYGDGVWIATDWNGAYRTSHDGGTFVDVTPTGAWISTSRRGSLGDEVHELAEFRYAGGRFIRGRPDTAQTPPSRIQFISSRDGGSWSEFGEVPGMPLPAGALDVEYSISDIAYADCRYVVAGTYSISIPGATDPPQLASEIGPFLLTSRLR